MGRAGFALDLDRCTGCSACAFACRIENDLAAGTSFRQVTTFNPERVASVPVLHLSLACNHCDRPACLAACPTRAYTRNAATGAVDLDANRCMGCRYCSWVCPYGAPQFDRSRGVMTKCTFCAPRVEHGVPPACVVACPVDALRVLESAAKTGPVVGTRGERLDLISVPGIPDTGLEPALELVSRIRWRPTTQEWRTWRPRGSHAPKWQRLRTEWPLAVFTFLVAVLVGWFGAGAWGGPLPRPLPFLALAALGLGASALHLGRPARMWRVLGNMRGSWISREVALVVAFLVAACAHFFLAPASVPLTGATVVIGLAAVIAIDLVYRIRGQLTRAIPHSGMATLTALYVAALGSEIGWLAAGVGLAKFALYVERHWRDWGTQTVRHSILAVVRITLGLLVPAVAWITGGSPLDLLVLASVLVAEALDRAEFYAELDFLTPERQAALDLAVRVAARPVPV